MVKRSSGRAQLSAARDEQMDVARKEREKSESQLGTSTDKRSSGRARTSAARDEQMYAARKERKEK
uniref:Uncharacterized protein n=1 Tax=Anopheles atroparvus TaxID=41427 RepID=A0AAG5DNN9_ANOAO